jgi:ribose-phosphate pyrophosphokinase
MNRIAIFTGTAHPSLAGAVCASMGMVGEDIELGKATVSSFSDGETRVQIEENVRGVDTYVIQPTCSPTNHNIMELLIMIDALRRASAGSITAVIPYFGYARQDRKAAPRTPISASMVADLIAAVQVNRVISVDLHAAQIQGFFRMPVDNLYAKPVLLPYLTQHYSGAVIVSPDAGGFERARAYSKAIPGSSVAAIDKRRARPNESEVMHIIGDVAGRRCLILDDMIDTAGTLIHGAEALLENGAMDVAACATHGVFSGPAAERLLVSDLVEVIVTDTISLPIEMRAAALAKKTTVITIAPLLAAAIRSIHHNDSVSSLFA